MNKYSLNTINKNETKIILFIACIAYSMTGFFQAFLGSIMPIIKEKMIISVELVAWHFSIYALGRLIAGFVAQNIIMKISINKLMILACSILTVVSTLIIIIKSVYATLFFSYLIGMSVGLLQISLQLNISKLENKNKEIVMARSIIFASVGSVVCTILASFSKNEVLQSILYFVPTAILTFLFFIIIKKLNNENNEFNKNKNINGISKTVILFWMLVICGNALEWGFGFWGAQYIKDILLTSPENSLKIMSLFFIGTILGRLLNAYVIKYFNCDDLNIIYITIYIIVFYILSSSENFHIVSGSVLVLGAASGCFYPNNMASAMKYAPDDSMRIVSGAAKCSGFSLLLFPLVIGYAAGSFGLKNAMNILQYLPFLMILLLFMMKLNIKSSDNSGT